MQIVTSVTSSGIRTRTANVPGRTYGSVVFGVGDRDEPVATAGMAHLVLHLIDAAVEPKLVPTSASIDENSLRFDVSGTTAQVLAYFRAIADAVGALGSVTTYELDRAKRLLEVESPHSYRHPGVDALTLRYGLGEIGRNSFGSPGVSVIGKKDVARWAASRLTAENTAVTLTKPLTASFDLDLPAGPQPTRGVPVALMTTPTLVAFENQGAVASITVPAAGADELGTAIKLDLRERLVDQAGLAYDVMVGHARVDESIAVLSFVVEPRFVDLPEVVRALVLALQDIADEGVSPAALTLAAEFTRLDLASDPASVCDSLAATATLELRGFGVATREERLASALALTSEGVATAVATALPTLIVAFDDDADLTKVAKGLSLPIDEFRLLRDVPEKRWKKATKGEGVVVFATKRSADITSAEAIVTPNALLHRFGDGAVMSVDFGDLVLVGERPDGTLVFLDSAGRWVPFRSGDWRDGKKFVKALRKALPPELVREFPAL